MMDKIEWMLDLRGTPWTMSVSPTPGQTLTRLDYGGERVDVFLDLQDALEWIKQTEAEG